MSLIEKFRSFTPNQKEKFFSVKDSAGFDVFLTESGIELTSEEKAQIQEYYAKGRLPLSDEELENVDGAQAHWRVMERYIENEMQKRGESVSERSGC
jgi:hypothetical protein